MTDADRRGVMFTSAKPFFATALHYLTGDLDDGEVKHQRHSGELHERDLTCVSLDGYQMGLGCVDSWERCRVPNTGFRTATIRLPS